MRSGKEIEARKNFRKKKKRHTPNHNRKYTVQLQPFSYVSFTDKIAPN